MERCADCPVDRLETAMDSREGALLRAGEEIRRLAQFCRLGLEDLTVEEWFAVQVLGEEEEAYRAELQKRRA